jgi:hypothetical protein
MYNFLFEKSMIDFVNDFIVNNPKDCELWMASLKPKEILVEGRHGSNVQIDHCSCLKGRKTYRTI